jgi:1-acyl-sn-glycerol-3-phosphate acyltransferase
MALQDYFLRIDKLVTLGESVSQELAEWSAPERRASLLERIAREAGEGSQELLTPLLDGSWRTPDEEIDRRINHLLAGQSLSRFGTDPFGFAPESLKPVVPILEFLHRVWFRTEVHDVERVPDGRCLVIANHSGQLPFDAAVIGASLLLDRDPPRMVRSMVEKFVTGLPFFGNMFQRWGQVTGLPDNCRRLLEAEECVQVFPEGARGISKPFTERYRMTPFGHGFMRLALETQTPIVPVAVVGAEEQTWNVYDVKVLARLLHMPAFPVTPLMPLLGPVAMLPSPVKYRVYFGEPMRFDGDENDDEAVIAPKVAEVRAAIQAMIDRGLAARKGWFI